MVAGCKTNAQVTGDELLGPGQRYAQNGWTVRVSTKR